MLGHGNSCSEGRECKKPGAEVMGRNQFCDTQYLCPRQLSPGPQKKTDLIREMLEEARAKEEEEDLRAAEAIRLAKLEERQDYVRRAWEMLTREREEYGKLQGALLLSEVSFVRASKYVYSPSDSATSVIAL